MCLRREIKNCLFLSTHSLYGKPAFWIILSPLALRTTLSTQDSSPTTTYTSVSFIITFSQKRLTLSFLFQETVPGAFIFRFSFVQQFQANVCGVFKLLESRKICYPEHLCTRDKTNDHCCESRSG
jgi:hypothetical protein